MNLWQAMMRALSSGRVILSSGFLVKMAARISLSSSEMGRMVLRKPLLLVKAR